MSYDSLIASRNTELQGLGVDSSTVSRTDAARGRWAGDWFDAGVDGNRLPITVPAGSNASSDIGSLADRVLATLGH